MRYDDWGYPRYVSVAEKRAKAQKVLERLKKKNPGVAPVLIQGCTIARSWWGKAWLQNLERYADYRNRIGRGRSYVRNGAVLDLQIGPGLVTALVQGTRRAPYKVRVEIGGMSGKRVERLMDSSAGKLRSLQELLAGAFPKELEEILIAPHSGLFPSPREIRFACSCPDWAAMCKHVAATLYGIGARLDQDPSLLFVLRKISLDRFVSRAVGESAKSLLQKAGKATADEMVMRGADLSALFGIDLAAEPAGKPPAPERPARTRSLPKEPAGKPPARRGPGVSGVAASEIARVRTIIRRSRKGVGVAGLMQRTGLSRTQIYAIVAKLKRERSVRSLRRGVYGKA